MQLTVEDGLLVGKDSIADALLRHFGSLKALSRASFKELRQFLPKGKAEAVMAALSISNVAEVEHALSAPLSNPEAIFRANLDMKGFHQEVVRVVLLDAQHRCITKVDISRGSVNQSLAHPREILLQSFFRSISWITSSLAGVSSVSRKRDFCNSV